MDPLPGAPWKASTYSQFLLEKCHFLEHLCYHCALICGDQLHGALRQSVVSSLVSHGRQHIANLLPASKKSNNYLPFKPPSVFSQVLLSASSSKSQPVSSSTESLPSGSWSSRPFYAHSPLYSWLQLSLHGHIGQIPLWPSSYSR